MAAKLLRCAIYTRKSTEHGLELEFNSLAAQREACAAYIKSQTSEGWRCLATRYDDPAYSGGNLDRPALQRLLKDIESGQIDVVVVYKIDRLTRSLTDFAKLVERFDAKSVSFVAVTQQFNTTTSMGRLTLNILLSFAQFERELSSERVRDKIAASRKKGIWTGGSVPLGYDNKDKKLVVNEQEAKVVRFIFQRYLALKSFDKLIDELDRKDFVSKVRIIKGRRTGGFAFQHSALSYLLKNRAYLGEVSHAQKWFKAEHEAIIDARTFDRVQQVMKANSEGRRGRRHRSGALLMGILFDDRGNRMSPSFAVKKGVRYPSYVSSALVRGRKAEAGSVPRVASPAIEPAVLSALAKKFGHQKLEPHEVIARHVEKITIESKQLVITLKSDAKKKARVLVVPWAYKTRDFARIDESASRMRPVNDDRTIQAIIRAHAWANQLRRGTYKSIEALAKSVQLHPKVLRKELQLAFLAPALSARLAQGDRRTYLRLKKAGYVIPLNWNEQRALTG